MLRHNLTVLAAVLFVTTTMSGANAQSPNATPATPTAATPQEAKYEYALMKTSKGDILLELDATNAPISVANFVEYVKKGFYDGTIFHRVIENFMIQGGGFDATLTQKETAPPIKNEWRNGLKNTRGTIAMARTSVPDSATSQFFINTVDNAMLDRPNGSAAYAVFGRVVVGMDAVDKIKKVPTGVGLATTPGGRGQMGDVPTEAVVIEKVTMLSKEDAVKRMQSAASAPTPTAPAK